MNTRGNARERDGSNKKRLRFKQHIWNQRPQTNLNNRTCKFTQSWQNNADQSFQKQKAASSRVLFGLTNRSNPKYVYSRKAKKSSERSQLRPAGNNWWSEKFLHYCVVISLISQSTRRFSSTSFWWLTVAWIAGGARCCRLLLVGGGGTLWCGGGARVCGSAGILRFRCDLLRLRLTLCNTVDTVTNTHINSLQVRNKFNNDRCSSVCCSGSPLSAKEAVWEGKITTASYQKAWKRPTDSKELYLLSYKETAKEVEEAAGNETAEARF